MVIFVTNDGLGVRFPNSEKKFLKKYIKRPSHTVVTPGLLQKMSKKCNNTGEFPGLLVSQNVTVRA